MARQPHHPQPLPKGWPRRVRSAAVHAIALARLALTSAREPLLAQPMVEMPQASAFTFGGPLHLKWCWNDASVLMTWQR
jgi:hypothetical protein